MRAAVEMNVTKAGQAGDFRAILRRELDYRVQHNPNYSLRAFARDLSLSPSRLSEIFSGKQGLSPKAAGKISAALSFSPEERDQFCDMVASAHGRSKAERDAARLRLREAELEDEIHHLRLDAFKVIADWYHLAILEMMSLKRYQSDTRTMARALGITEIQAELAIDRLIRLKLLERQDGKLVPLKGPGLIPGGIPSDSIKKFHSQILDQAKEALIIQSVEEREFQVSIMAVDRSQLPEAKADIEKFRRKFCRRMDEAQEKDGLYCLAIQFYNLERG
jgi:uncharacterized protein (TIGR02147 family)